MPVAASAAPCAAVGVSWGASVDQPNGSGLARYRVYRDALLVAEVDAPATVWSDAGVAPAAYVYGVAAVDRAGNASATAAAPSLVVPPCGDVTPPAKPKGLKALPAACDRVELTWKPASDGGGSGLAGYDVHRDGAWLARVVAPAASDAGVAPGPHAYAVRAVDGAGNLSAASATVTATVPGCGGTPPVADAGPNHATQTLTALAFDGGGSHDPDGAIAAYAWSFGDGTSASGRTVSHAYARPGTWVVTLTVTADDGGTATDTATVTAANRAPVAAAGPDRSAAAGSALAFDGGASSDPDGTITAWAWTFGDGGAGSGPTPSHAYAAPGTYTVTLTVADDEGARGTDTARVTVGAAGELLWTRTFGGPTFVDGITVHDAAATPDGGVAVTGVLTGAVGFGAGTVTSAGNNDAFVAAWGADGQLRWARRFGGPGQEFGAAVAVGADGDVTVTGGFDGTVDFGGGGLTSAGSYDVFVLRLSSAGAHRWSRRGGGPGDDSGAAVAMDAAGDVVVAGTISGAATLGGATLAAAGGRDIAVARYAAATGAHVWSQRFGGPGLDAPVGLVADADGSVVLAGSFAGTVGFGGAALASAGGADVVLARYTGSTGAHRWSKRFGGPGDDQPSGLALAPNGDLVLVGQFAGTIDFGAGVLANAGAPDIFAARLGTDAAPVWSRRWGTPSAFALVATGVAVAPDGAVVFAGNAIETISFGGPPLPASGGYDPYLVKLDAGGTHLWSRRSGSSGYPYNWSAAVAIDAAGAIFATGSFSGGIDLGDGLLANAGGLVNQSYDGFVTKRRP